MEESTLVEENYLKARRRSSMNRLRLLKAVTQILPLILSIIIIVHSIIYFLLEEELRVFSLIGGSSILAILYLWIASWCFRFCFYQKIFLYYLSIIQVLNMIDEYYTLPINTYNYYMVSYITFGCTIMLYAILKFKENKRKNEFKNS